MQKGLRTGGIIVKALFQAEAVQDELDISLYGEEIAVAVGAERKLHALVRKLRERQRLREIDICHLIEADIPVLPLEIRGKRSQHPIRGARPEDGEILPQRVLNPDLPPLRGILRKQKSVAGLRRLKGIEIGLGVAERLRAVPASLVDRELLRKSPDRGSGGEAHRDRGIAVEAGDLLRDIAHPVDILAEGRGRDGEIFPLELCRELLPLQDGLHLLRRERGSQESIDLG